MNDNVYSLSGDTIEPETITIPKAQELVKMILTQKVLWVKLVECLRVIPKDISQEIQKEQKLFEEIIVLDVEVEIPQHIVHDIKREERLAIIFSSEDKNYPFVLALRKDFPIDVPHLSLQPFDQPRCLCLSEVPYDEFKIRWTAPLFIEMIRNWLAKTAIGTLHAPDQPLEPLFLGSPPALILPSSLFSNSDEPDVERLNIYRIPLKNNLFNLIAVKVEDDQQSNNGKKPLEIIATIIWGQPQVHGIINAYPTNLLELHTLLKKAEIDLLNILRSRISAWHEADKNILNASLTILTVLPKKRDILGEVESIDVGAFICSIDPDTQSASHKKDRLTICEIGAEIGLWDLINSEIGRLISVDESKKGERVKLATLNPHFKLSPQTAAQYNGLPFPETKRILAVGMGSLGSQIFFNLIRSGFGDWTLIDKDFILPHNLARHGLLGVVPGNLKVDVVAHYANETLDGEKIAHPIYADILNPGDAANEISEKLSKSDLIFDFSASVSVSRYISNDIDTSARRISSFLNPPGTDLVLLAEDAQRTISLDSLEMQYYRVLIEKESLHNHLISKEQKIRYGRSCRDLSSTIPQDLIALHAANASRILKKIVNEPSAGIYIWRTNDFDQSVSYNKYEPAQTMDFNDGGWSVRTDKYLIGKLLKERSIKLPNETGGVLIGYFDTQRKIVYVVDSISSPSDSKEGPTFYERGCMKLEKALEEIKVITADQIAYVGEWHSHPSGYSCNPSKDDKNLFDWLRQKIEFDGLPPVMLIIGDNGQTNWKVSSL
jgi:hypothetical protein